MIGESSEYEETWSIETPECNNSISLDENRGLKENTGEKKTYVSVFVKG